MQLTRDPDALTALRDHAESDAAVPRSTGLLPGRVYANPRSQPADIGKTKRAVQQFSSPEELYLSGTLPRTTGAVDSLWLHQGDVIGAYAENHQHTSDLALELPPVTGKILPGLLIGEWVRRKAGGPVIYATPTKQTAAVGIASEQDQKQHVRSVMTENGCLPSQVIDRLTQNRDQARRLMNRNEAAERLPCATM